MKHQPLEAFKTHDIFKPTIRPLATKTDLSLACELERRQIKKHSIINEMMVDALPGESFSALVRRMQLSTRPRRPYGPSKVPGALLFLRYRDVCKKEQEAIDECRARFGDAVKFASSWPSYVAKRARDGQEQS